MWVEDIQYSKDNLCLYHWRKWHLSPNRHCQQSLQVMWGLMPLPTPIMEFCASLVQITTAPVNPWVQWLCPIQKPTPSPSQILSTSSGEILSEPLRTCHAILVGAQLSATLSLALWSVTGLHISYQLLQYYVSFMKAMLIYWCKYDISTTRGV